MYIQFDMQLQPAQIYFPKPIYFQLKQLAKEDNKGFATWAREVLTRELKKKNSKRMKMEEIPKFKWKTGDPHVSEKIDQIVYGRP